MTIRDMIAHHRAEGITVTVGNQKGWNTIPERERSDGSIFKTDLARRTRPITEHHCRVVGYLSFPSLRSNSGLPHGTIVQSSR